MENNKISISLTTIIIIAVIVGALILGIISFIVYNNINKDNNSTLSQTQDTKQTQNPSTLNGQANNSNNSSLNNSETANNNNNSAQQNISSSQSSSVTGKSSSKSNPLSIGEWGLASKYSSSDYVDVPVKVTNVTRGNSATQMVKDYCNSGSSIYKYEDAKDGMEWAVIDYTVDLTNIKGYSTGKDIKVDSKITGTGNNNSIKYNGATYIVSTMNMTSRYSKENIANGQFAVQLPIGCTDYLIALGSSSHTQAFFNGK